MVRINLTEEELNKLKVICDLVFFDEYKDVASFSRFEKIFGLFFFEHQISLQKVFKEICGERKKYITFPRMIKAYLTYKNSPGQLSLDTKKFFSEMLTNILKGKGEFAGINIEGAQKFSTLNWKRKSFISKVSVLTGKDKIIEGLSLEYEGIFKGDLYPSTGDSDLNVRLEMLMSPLEDKRTIKEKLCAANEIKYVDSVTHIFGTFTSKIEFIGFKTRGGKVRIVGKPKGEPFLFGKYGSQFHFAKIQCSGGMNLFEPHFIRSPRTNLFLKVELKDITEDFIEDEPLVGDESVLQNVQDEIDLEKLILAPIIEDDHFFTKGDEDEIQGDEIEDVITFEPKKWQVNEEEEQKEKTRKDEDLVSLEDIITEAEKPAKLKGGKGGRGGTSTERKRRPKKTRVVHRERRHRRGDLKEEEKKNPSPETWNAATAKEAKPTQFLSSVDNYQKLMNSVGDDIQNEINNEKAKLKTVKGNFYDSYLKNHPGFEKRKESSPPKIKNLDKLEKRFNVAKERAMRTGNKLRGAYKRNIAPADGNKERVIKSKNFKGETIVRKVERKGKPSSKHSGWDSGFFSGFMDDDDEDFFGDDDGYVQYSYEYSDNPSSDSGSILRAYHNNTVNRYGNNYNNNYNYLFDDEDDDYFVPSWKRNKYTYIVYEDGKGNRKIVYQDDSKKDNRKDNRKDDRKDNRRDDRNDKRGDKDNKRKDRYKDEDEDEDEEEKGNEEEQDKEEEEEEQEEKKDKPKNKFLEFYNNYYKDKYEEDPEADERAQKNWKKVSEDLRKNQGVDILTTMGAVLKAIHVLQRSEDSEKKYPLKERIKLYMTLEENQKIVQFLETARKTAALRKEEEEKEKKRKEEEERKRKEEEEEEKRREEERRRREEEEEEEEERRKQKEAEELEEDDDEEEAEIEKYSKNLSTLSLEEVNERIASIEKKFSTIKDKEMRNKMSRIYEALKKQRNNLIASADEEAKQQVIDDNKINTDKLMKEEEDKRKKAKEEAKEFIEGLDLKDFFSKQEEKRKQAKAIVVSTRSKPSPDAIYKEQEIHKGKDPFVDPEFPPERNSLCPYDPKTKKNIYPPGIVFSDVVGWEKLKWSRPEDIFGTENYQVFFEGISAGDIIQGQLGDCYFLSAVAALCQFPKEIEKLFYIKEKSEEHCYGVYLRINGMWELVLVDDFIPSIRGGLTDRFFFSSANGNELWMVLIEKAWAKINGSYAKTIGGEPHEVFDVITEAYSEKFDISPKFQDKIWEGLLKGQSMGFLMTAGSSSDDYRLDLKGVGIEPGHAYTVMGVYEVNTGITERLIKLRNPWGEGEWSGDWCDTSSKWTDKIRKQLGFYKGLNDEEPEDDGVFFMPFSDFLQYFCTMGICKLHNNYEYQVNKLRKEACQKPRVTKFVIKNDNTHVYIQFYQKNPRIMLRDGTYQNPVLGFILLVDGDFNFIESITATEMTTCIERTLKKGTYYVVTDLNYRFSSKLIHGYVIATYSNEKVPLFPELKINAPEILAKACRQYVKENGTTKVEAGGAVKVYSSKQYSKVFPFIVVLFENTSRNPITLNYVVKSRGVKSYAYYCDDQYDEDSTEFKKKIEPKKDVLVLIMPYSTSSLLTMTYELSGEVDMENMSEIVFKEEPTELDDEGEVLEYAHETEDGSLIVGIENKSSDSLELKLTLKGYEFKQKEYTGQRYIIFDLGKREKKAFFLQPKKGYFGDKTYIFDTV